MPFLISFFAAAATRSSVSRLSVPSSSLSPYRPHAEYIGASFWRGRSSNSGIPLAFNLNSALGAAIMLAICCSREAMAGGCSCQLSAQRLLQHGPCYTAYLTIYLSVVLCMAEDLRFT